MGNTFRHKNRALTHQKSSKNFIDKLKGNKAQIKLETQIYKISRHKGYPGIIAYWQPYPIDGVKKSLFQNNGFNEGN